MKLSQPLRWVALGAVAYLLLAVITAPASLLFRWIAPDNVTASGVNGTVWRGSAERITMDQMPLHDVSWVVKPLAFLTFKAGASLEAKIPGGQIRGEIANSFFGQTGVAKNIRAVVDLESLGIAIGQPFLVNGKMGIILERLSWKSGQLSEITGNVTLAELSDMITSTLLGTFEIEFPDNQNEQIRGIIKDVDAIFKLDGAVTITSAGAYQFDAVIQPTADTSPEVVDSLPMIGAQRDPDGNYAVSSSGSIYTGR
ncbi:MAG: type II secretion system protein N [Gammaproteobacteria bacterium]|nr:type II secretion system protein N [Gammaproteobacteria bacterium]